MGIPGAEDYTVEDIAIEVRAQRPLAELGLGSVVEVTQSEVAVTLAQTRLAEALYDYKIAEVTLAYATTGHSELELDPIIR